MSGAHHPFRTALRDPSASSHAPLIRIRDRDPRTRPWVVLSSSPTHGRDPFLFGFWHDRPTTAAILSGIAEHPRTPPA